MKMNSNRLRSNVCNGLALASLTLLTSNMVEARDPTFTPQLSTELRYFPEDPAHDGQFSGVQPSLILSGDGRWVSDDRKQRVKFEPFLRVDGRDAERTHGDIRELSYSHRFGDFDLLAGVGQIFWGVAESRNVVDVINQYDTVENSDETDKLGQPLIRIGTFTDVGRFEAFYLPYFRERTFPGTDGRQRTALVVDTDRVEYERSGEETAGDFALRYKTQWDAFDIGLHAFYGTNRTPFSRLSDDGSRLIPIYQKLTQGGADVQWTSDEWLLKFEGVTARSGDHTYVSSVAGFEYTFFDIKESGMDLGLLAEGLIDTRDETKTALTLFENDVFLGSRLTWNDIAESEILVGAIIDWESGATFGSIEYETRLTDNMTLEVEGQILASPASEPIAAQEKDSNLTVRVNWFF